MNTDLEPRMLADTDLSVSRLIFGTMTFGAQVDAPEATRMVNRCLEHGITMFDTSNNYTDGAAETMLGDIVKSFRDQVQIATKVGNQRRDDPAHRGLSRSAILAAVDGSLTRLGTDYIDLFYLHMPDRSTPLEESLGAFDEVVRAGKVRHVAQSNHPAWQIVEMRWLAERHGWSDMRVSQPIYNLFNRHIEGEYAECSSNHGLANIVYNPLAGGLLTGKHQPDTEPAPGSRFTKENYRARYWKDEYFALVDELGGIAGDADMTLIELSLRWLLSRPLTDHVLLGASSLEQLDVNLAASAGPAPNEGTCARIDDIWERVRGCAMPYYR